MSLLDRYKKTGGFVQLLSLLETCGETKKQKFLSMILEENSTWHDALIQRILTLDKILKWPPEVLSEATSRSMPITLAAINKSLDETQSKIFLTGLNHSHISKIREVSENKLFSTNEITSSIEKFLGEIRKLTQQGVIKLDKISQDLVIPDKFEDQLDRQSLEIPSLPHELESSASTTIRQAAKNHQANESSNPVNKSSLSSVSSGHSEETVVLRQQIQGLQKELTHLRQENQILRDKLEKIKKIA